MAAVLKVGDIFGSLKEVQDKAVAFEKEARVNYNISDSQTIEKAIKNPQLATLRPRPLTLFFGSSIGLLNVKLSRSCNGHVRHVQFCSDYSRDSPYARRHCFTCFMHKIVDFVCLNNGS